MKTPGETFAASILTVIFLMLGSSLFKLVIYVAAFFDIGLVGRARFPGLGIFLSEAVAVLIYSGCIVLTRRSRRNSPVFMAISGLTASFISVIAQRQDFTTYIGMCFCIILILLKFLMSDEQWDDPGRIFKFKTPWPFR